MSFHQETSRGRGFWIMNVFYFFFLSIHYTRLHWTRTGQAAKGRISGYGGPFSSSSSSFFLLALFLLLSFPSAKRVRESIECRCGCVLSTPLSTVQQLNTTSVLLYSTKRLRDSRRIELRANKTTTKTMTAAAAKEEDEERWIRGNCWKGKTRSDSFAFSLFLSSFSFLRDYVIRLQLNLGN